ncbi:MAG: HD domain-containing protein [Methanoregula sp.]|nr:HD domain-containing protein [Methanoregula sp.]
MDTVIEEIRRYAKSALGDAGSHGMDHTDRVTRMCRMIGDREHAAMDILIPAALLHDIARPLEKEKGLSHEREGALMAEAYLASIHYNPALIPAISAAIHTHRFRSGERPVSAEAKILSDADKLDAMGAVGIARTFMRAAEHGGDIEDAVMHFHDKLLKLQDLMYTKTGRDIANERHAFLVTFLNRLSHETGVSSP